METSQKELRSYLEEKLKKSIAKKEVEKAKHDLLTHLDFMRDGNDHAMELYLGLACGFDLETLENWREKIEAVRPEQVIEAFKVIFKENPVVSVELYPDLKKSTES